MSEQSTSAQDAVNQIDSVDGRAHLPGLEPVEAEPTAADTEAAARKVPKTLVGGLVKALRPRQWVKNVLVLAAPAAAGSVFHWNVLGPVALAFVVFCMAASSIYLINDARDVDADRAHPTKRYRPIAAGVLPVQIA